MVLIVEHDKALCDFYRDILLAAGFSSTGCADVTEAAQLIACQDFKMLISDYYLAKYQTALDLLKYRHLNPQAFENWILITAYPLSAQSIHGVFSGVLYKPFHYRELTTLVQRLLDRQK